MSTDSVPVPSEPTKPPSLAEYAETYISSRMEMSKSSIHQIRVAIRVFDRWAGHPVMMNELCDDLVLQFMQQYRKDGATQRTCNTKRSVIVTLWRHAYRKRVIAELPRDLPKVKQPKRIPRAWTIQEFAKIVKAAGELEGTVGPWQMRTWFPALLLTLFYTGGRITAVMNLKMCDVSLDARTLILFEPKTQKEIVCRIPQQLAEALGRIWAPREKLFGDWPLDWTRPVWESLNRVLTRCIDAAEVPHAGKFHAVRRSAATMIYDQDRVAAQEFLGHHALSQTEGHYIDRSKLTKRLANELLPELDMQGGFLPTSGVFRLLPSPEQKPRKSEPLRIRSMDSDALLEVQAVRHEPELRRVVKRHLLKLAIRSAMRARRIDHEELAEILGADVRELKRWTLNGVPHSWWAPVEAWIVSAKRPSRSLISTAKTKVINRRAVPKEIKPELPTIDLAKPTAERTVVETVALYLADTQRDLAEHQQIIDWHYLQLLVREFGPRRVIDCTGE